MMLHSKHESFSALARAAGAATLVLGVTLGCYQTMRRQPMPSTTAPVIVTTPYAAVEGIVTAIDTTSASGTPVVRLLVEAGASSRYQGKVWCSLLPTSQITRDDGQPIGASAVRLGSLVRVWTSRIDGSGQAEAERLVLSAKD